MKHELQLGLMVVSLILQVFAHAVKYYKVRGFQSHVSS